MTTLTSEDRIIKARVELLYSEPFFGSLVMGLKPILVPASVIDTMGVTPSGHLLFCNEFVESLSMRELVGSMCHEVLHVALDVFGRAKWREHSKWNRAHDYAINIIVKDNGMDLPDKCLYDEQYRDMTAEEIYDKLPDEPPCDGKGMGQGRGCADHTDFDGLSDSEKREIQDNWKNTLAQAAQSAKSQGRIPAGLERLLKDILEPKLDWRTILSRFIRQCVRGNTNYTWLRPSRRSYSTGVLLPSLKKGRQEVWIAIDTSGSISDKFLKTGLAESQAILDELRAPVRFIIVDAIIQEDFKTDDIVETAMKMKGRGGTVFTEVFERLSQPGLERPAGLIFFTDLWADGIPDIQPRIPVLWCVPPKHGNAPWGSLIEVEVEDKKES